MKKYYLIVKTEFQRQLTYRIENYAYRFANLFDILAILAVWTIGFQGGNIIGGYTKSQMITYVLVGWLFVFISRTYGFSDYVADDIFEGRISNFLVKPVSYLRYISVLSVARSSLSVFSALIMQSVIIAIFSKYIIFNADAIRVILILAMLACSYVIMLFSSILTGMIAFWTQRITGIDYTINMTIRLLAGTYFPISLLPGVFLKIDKFFPFIYTLYYPANMFIGKIGNRDGAIGLGVEIIWIFIFYGIIKIMWKHGSKKFEGVGI